MNNLEQFCKRKDEEDLMMEGRIKELMSENESCDPFGVTIHKNVPYVYYNLFEGLSEVPESEQKIISEMWREAAKHSDTDPIYYNGVKARVFEELDKLVRAYWAKCAKHQAEREHE